MAGGIEMFCPIISSIGTSCSPIVPQLFSVRLVSHPPIFHVSQFCCFWWQILHDKTQSSGVICLYWCRGLNISFSVVLARIACREFRNNALISASAADAIVALMSCAIFSTDPLFAGSISLFDMKKMTTCPAFGLVFA